jgi:hypothetical protein
VGLWVSTVRSQISPKLRVKQTYDEYLDALYAIEYYKRVYKDVRSYSRHFDFIISLSGALSGGSGLGILASPWMAIPCSIITAAAVIFTVARQTYDWPARAAFAVDMIEKNGTLSGKLKNFVQDIQVTRAWNTEFDKRFDEIRSEVSNLPADKFPELSLTVRSSIQNEIIERECPQTWWKPKGDEDEKGADPAA